MVPRMAVSVQVRPDGLSQPPPRVTSPSQARSRGPYVMPCDVERSLGRIFRGVPRNAGSGRAPPCDIARATERGPLGGIPGTTAWHSARSSPAPSSSPSGSADNAPGPAGKRSRGKRPLTPDEGPGFRAPATLATRATRLASRLTDSALRSRRPQRAYPNHPDVPSYHFDSNYGRP